MTLPDMKLTIILNQLGSALSMILIKHTELDNKSTPFILKHKQKQRL